MKILVTGAAGFIGYHVCKKLIALGHAVVGLDNINDYYDVNLKLARLLQLGIVANPFENEIIESQKYKAQFRFIKLDIADRKSLPFLFETEKFDAVCNLAAQAGVRYSLENPFVYAESNVLGFLNILEACRHNKIAKLVYASSSSVYGANSKIPFSTEDPTDHPISLYAATKKSNELMAHTYSHLFGIKMIGLRFFTVYGPWGRPDMAMFLFTDAILKGKAIKVFNGGDLSRDFTYIDDIVDGVTATLLHNRKKSASLHEIYNIGNSKPIKLLDFISEIEKCTGKRAIKELLPMQPGDVEKTWADVKKLEEDYDYKPQTNIGNGVGKFVEWYRNYYKV